MGAKITGTLAIYPALIYLDNDRHQILWSCRLHHTNLQSEVILWLETQVEVVMRRAHQFIFLFSYYFFFFKQTHQSSASDYLYKATTPSWFDLISLIASFVIEPWSCYTNYCLPMNKFLFASLWFEYARDCGSMRRSARMQFDMWG